MRALRNCPWCGGLLAAPQGVSQTCSACGETSYLNPKPCSVALVVDDAGRVLLGRRAGEPQAGAWDLPGGFIEPGETPEQGLRRELREETGLDVEPVEYVGSFSDTYGEGGDTTLNIAFTCRVRGGSEQAADDVSELRWFAPDALPPRERLAFENTAQALAAWRARAGAGR